MSWMVRKMLAARGLLREENNGDGNDLGGGNGAGDNGDGAGDAGAGDAAGGAGAAAGAGAGESKPKISDAEAKLLKEVMDKKGALKKANEELAAARQRIAEFDGIDPAEIKALLKARKDAETEQLVAKGEWDRLKAQMAEEHGKEKGTLVSQLSEKDQTISTLQATIAELTVGSAFSQSQFIREEVTLTPTKTRVVYGSHFGFEDGKVVGYDKPAGTPNRTVLVDASGEPLAFEAALRKIVEADPEKDQVLRTKMKAGAGSKTAPKTGAAGAPAGEPVFGQAKIAAALAKGLLKK